MVFNGAALDMDICGLADRFAKTDDTDFPLSDKALYANLCLREIFTEDIISVYDGWRVIDSNISPQTLLSKADLVIGTRFYAFPLVSIIDAVEWMDSDGNVYPLIPITLEQIRERKYAEPEFFDTPGNPQYYKPELNGIQIYPACDSAVTNGLIVHIGAQDVSPFTEASTTQQPGYDSLAKHEVVSMGMAAMFAQINTLDSATTLYERYLIGRAGIKSFYAKKFKEHKPSVRHRGNELVRQMY